jgi:hypothetical protein
MLKRASAIFFIILTWLSATAFQPLPQNAIVNYSPPSSAAEMSFTTAQATFGKLAPTNGDYSQPTSGVTLKWESINLPGATYQYCLRGNLRQSCPTSKWVNAGSDLTAILSGLASNTIYYWQVRAKDNAGNYTYANGGAWWSFKTVFSAPAAFGKTSPQNGVTAQPLSLTLSWGASSGISVYYEYCLADVPFTAAACSGIWNRSDTTSVQINGLNYGTSYYWQVRATNISGTTYANSGTVWHFTTQSAPPSTFVKLSPSNGAKDEPSNPTLEWSPSSGATQYTYCIDTSNNNLCDTGWLVVPSGTSIPLSNLVYNTTYYWQVTASNSAGTIQANDGIWSSFKTISAQPSAFDKILPTNISSDQSLTPWLYWWSPDDAGVTYSYCMDTGPACSGSWIPITRNTPIHITTALDYNHTYYWQVKAGSSGGTTEANGGVWWSFTTVKTPPSSSDQGFSTAEDTPFSGQLTATSNYTKTFTIAGGLPIGQLDLKPDGSFTYTPSSNYRGQVTFQFMVSDGFNPPAGPFTASIMITAVSHAPVLEAIPDQIVASGDLVYFLATATDPDMAYGDSLTYSLVAPSPAGMIINASNGVFIWATPNTLEPGTYKVTIKVTDSDLNSDTQEVTIVVYQGIPVTGGATIFLPVLKK